MRSKVSLYDYVEPYFNKHYDGKHGYFYIPPKDSDGYCAVALCEKGAHVSFNVFTSYAKNFGLCHKELIAELITKLLGETVIKTDLPAFTRASVANGKDYEILHIKTDFPEHKGQRGVIEVHIPLPEGYKVSLLGEWNSVKSLPEYAELPSEKKDGRTEIILPKITGYKSFVFEK